MQELFPSSSANLLTKDGGNQIKKNVWSTKQPYMGL